PHWLAFMEKDERGNALHPKLLGHGGVLVHVDFDDAQLALVLGRYLLQNGRHRFAWAAPVGIKIDEHGHAGAINEFGKGLARHGK
nr:hypothetical protein [Tanacetum cinerariifolium]